MGPKNVFILFFTVLDLLGHPKLYIAPKLRGILGGTGCQMQEVESLLGPLHSSQISDLHMDV